MLAPAMIDSGRRTTARQWVGGFKLYLFSINGLRHFSLIFFSLKNEKSANHIIRSYQFSLPVFGQFRRSKGGFLDWQFFAMPGSEIQPVLDSTSWTGQSSMVFRTMGQISLGLKIFQKKKNQEICFLSPYLFWSRLNHRYPDPIIRNPTKSGPTRLLALI